MTSTDRALSMLHALVVNEQGETWGETATQWQKDDAAALVDVDGAEAVRKHFITRPRGGRKTSDIAAVMIAVLLAQAPVGAHLYSYSIDKALARLVLDSMREMLRWSGLAGAILVMANEARANVRLLEDGRTQPINDGPILHAESSDEASANGLRIYFAIVDEFCHWPDNERRRSLFSTLLSLSFKGEKDMRLAVISNAGSPSHSLAWNARKLALGSRSWRVNETPGPLPWLSVEDLAELRAEEPIDAVFRRLHMNEWVDGGDRLTTTDDIDACVRLTGGWPQGYIPGVRYALGVDLALTGDYAAAALCHLAGGDVRYEAGEALRTGAAVVVDDLRVWKPGKGADGNTVAVDLYDVERWVLSVALAHGAVVHLDQHQAASMHQSLIRGGVRSNMRQFTQAFNNTLAVTLFRLLREHMLWIPDEQELKDELGSIVLRETSPNLFKLDTDRHRKLGHHDRATAIGLAAHELLAGTQSSYTPPRRIVYGGRLAHRNTPSPQTHLLTKLAHAGDRTAIAALRRPTQATTRRIGWR